MSEMQENTKAEEKLESLEKQKEINDKAKTNSPSTLNEVQQPQEGSFSLKKIMFLFLFYSLASSAVGFFKIFNPIYNGLNHKDSFTIKFYTTDFLTNEASSLEKLTPTIVETFYDSKGEFEPFYLNLTTTNIKLNDNEDEIKKIKLYLYAVGSLPKERETELSNLMNSKTKKSKDNFFFTRIELLKFDKDLKNKIRRIKAMAEDEVPSTSDNDQEIALLNTTIHNQSNFNITSISHLYYKPEITYYIVSADKEIESSNIAEFNFLNININFNPLTKTFVPPTYLTDFWLMTKELQPLEKNSSLSLNVTIDIRTISSFKFKYLRNFEKQDKLMNEDFGLDSTKDPFIEILKTNSTNYLFVLFTVQILHTVFSFMGFASDISYHKKLNKLDGLYTKIYFISLFHYFIAVIYYYMENVSKIIYFELMISLVIELWKFRKIYSTNFSLSFPFVSFEHKIKFEEADSKSLESEAIRLTSKVIFIPLALIYLFYRVYYYNSYILLHPFKFIIEYFFFLLNIFGFVLMTPQIYINYKLKSVEHMPIKKLSYKFLNTIIDDLFAFALETPTLHRISVFKDDVIFVIYIGQLIAYRKNKRVEEVQTNENQLENNSLEDKKNN